MSSRCVVTSVGLAAQGIQIVAIGAEASTRIGVVIAGPALAELVVIGDAAVSIRAVVRDAAVRIGLIIRAAASCFVLGAIAGVFFADLRDAAARRANLTRQTAAVKQRIDRLVLLRLRVGDPGCDLVVRKALRL